MRLIDADKLLKAMGKRYDEKKDIVPDNLAEGFMQMDSLIHEQDAFDLEAHNAKIRVEAIDEFAKWLARQYGMFSPVELRNGVTSFEELNADEIVVEYLDKLKEKENGHGSRDGR